MDTNDARRFEGLGHKLKKTVISTARLASESVFTGQPVLVLDL